MKIEPTKLPGVFVVVSEAHEDVRGYVMETFRADLLVPHGAGKPLRQVHDVYSVARNTVRGLNFQYDPPMAKLVRVPVGSAFLVAVDIRKGSPTLGQWVGIEANAENKKALYAPAGFARGAQTLQDNTLVQYYCDEVHDGAAREQAVAWDDPDIAIAWPITEEPQHTKAAPTLKAWLALPESDRFTYPQ